MSKVFDRRLALLRHLCKVRHEKRENLMFKFGVSKNTLDEDLLALSDFPIYTMTGPQGGVYIEDGFTLGNAFLTEQQLEVLERIKETLSPEDKQVVASVIFDFKKPRKRKEETTL